MAENAENVLALCAVLYVGSVGLECVGLEYSMMALYALYGEILVTY